MWRYSTLVGSPKVSKLLKLIKQLEVTANDIDKLIESGTNWTEEEVKYLKGNTRKITEGRVRYLIDGFSQDNLFYLMQVMLDGR